MKSMLHQLANAGWATAPHFLVEDEIQHLQTVWQKNRHHAAPARISKNKVHSPQIRGDSILWLDQVVACESPATGLSSKPLNNLNSRLDQLRRTASEELFLNLHDYEAHFACYPPGAGYQAHYDQPLPINQSQSRQHGQRQGLRLLSLVIYLNSNWQPEHGGQLVIWADEAKSNRLAQIEPRAGTLVIFRSDQIFHEVLTAQAERLSITGWFRREQPMGVS